MHRFFDKFVSFSNLPVSTQHHLEARGMLGATKYRDKYKTGRRGMVRESVNKFQVLKKRIQPISDDRDVALMREVSSNKTDNYG